MEVLEIYSGGGSRIFSHIGAAKAMEDVGESPTILGGTSAGLYVAIARAMGKLDELYDYMKKNHKWINSPYNRNNNLKLSSYCNLVFSEGITHQDDYKLLSGFLSDDDWKSFCESDCVDVYFNIVCMDNGKRVIDNIKNYTNKEDAFKRILACGRVPVFTPCIEIDGLRWADGGIRDHNMAGELAYKIGNISKLNSISVKPKMHFSRGKKAFQLLPNLITIFTLESFENDLRNESKVVKDLGIEKYHNQHIIDDVMINQYDVDLGRQVASYDMAYQYILDNHKMN